MNLKKNLMKKFAGVCGIVVIMMVMMPIVTAPVMAATRKMPKMIYTDTKEPVPESSKGYQVDPEHRWIDLYASGVTITGDSTYTVYAHGTDYVVHDYSAPGEIFSLYGFNDATVELGNNNTFGSLVANSKKLTLKGSGTQKIQDDVDFDTLIIEANGTLTFQPITSRYIYGIISGVLKVTSGTFEYKGDSTTNNKYFFTLENDGCIELQEGYVMKGAASPKATSLSNLTMDQFKDYNTYHYYTVKNGFKNSVASYIKIYPAGIGSIFSQGNIIIIIALSIIAIAVVVLIIMKRKKTAQAIKEVK